MARSLKKPDAGKRSTVPAKLPGVPLLSPVEASDLMLAKLHREPFSGDGWLFELKFK
ncbi:hypothetical protein [Burkholderia stagnalis]|uniref:hypothetical protein n=1 Tax=Burkholderia stagnalis TaxID=1503054 RepID=UPI000ACE31EA|nr:hypothetical protein [Burkholderia stagnalis]